MNSKEKRIAYFDLKGGQHFRADLALLKEKDADNDWCKKKVFNPDKAAPEILFALLDHASKEEVVANRRKFSKSTVPEEFLLIAEECGTLTGKIEKAVTIEEADALLAEAQKELLVADIVALHTEEMLSLLSRLGIFVTDQDPEVLRSALQDAWLQLEKTDEDDGNEKTEISAVPDQENELKVENEDLKEQLDQKEEEIYNLESENEDLQAENETLVEELEVEKKNQQPAPDQQPAVNSKKKKNSPK